MIRLALALVLMFSAISLVTARYQARELYVATERLSTQAHELEIEWRRLQLERAELARNARIDHVAREDLEMVTGSPERTLYVRGGTLSSSVISAASGGAR